MNTSCRAVTTGPNRINRHKSPCLQAPFDIEKVKHLIQRVPFARDGWTDASWSLQRRQDLRTGIGSARARRNARRFEELIRRQTLEEIHGCVEVIWDFLTGLVVRVARCGERGDAGSMRGPFVFPESFVGLGVGDPVCAHVVQKGGRAEVLEDGGYVVVVSGGVTVFFELAVAEIGPGELG